MKKIANWKKGIALILATVIMVSGFAISNVYAARAIDTTTKCTVSVSIADMNDESNADLDRAYNTMQLSSVEFSVKLYKVADVTKSAVYTITDAFKGVADVDGKEIEELSSVTASEWIDIVDNANKIVEANEQMQPDFVIDVANGQGSNTNVNVGLYLVVVPEVVTDTESYTFKNYLIQLPYVDGAWTLNENNEYAFVGEDEWIYNVKLNWATKYERTDRLTGIQISKTVDTFNKSMNDTSFVYSIVAEKNYSTDPENPKMVRVFDDIRSIDFSQAGTNKITVENIPAGSVVTVKEIYAGATYQIVGENEVKLDQLAVTEEYPVVSFENTYDEKLIGNGTAVVNTYSKGETGWNWTSEQEVQNNENE